MNRKEFFAKVGFGAAMALVPACILGLETSCSKDNPEPVNGQNPLGNTPPTNVDFTVDVSTGNLANNGDSLVKNGVIIAKLLNGSGFIAVAAACTHAGTTVNYVSGTNSFKCPNHQAEFSSTGAVTLGPATTNLKQYQTALTGNSLRVFS
jgi:cytochrome b6-f complex iron-sulfur subunit